MNARNIYAQLHGEMDERETPPDLASRPLNSYWNNLAPSERKLVEADDTALAEDLDNYTDTLDEFNDAWEVMQLSSYREAGWVREALHDDMLKYREPDKLGASGSGSRHYIDTHQLIRDTATSIVKSGTPAELGEGVRSTAYANTHDNEAVERIIEDWEANDIAWEQHLFDLVTHEEYSIKDRLEQRDELRHEITGQAQELKTALDAKLEDDPQSSLADRLRDLL